MRNGDPSARQIFAYLRALAPERSGRIRK